MFFHPGNHSASSLRNHFYNCAAVIRETSCLRSEKGMYSLDPQMAYGYTVEACCICGTFVLASWRELLHRNSLPLLVAAMRFSSDCFLFGRQMIPRPCKALVPALRFLDFKNS